ncbi:hypothetical protein AN219_26630, partial [Streptomyces nanshensis]
LATRPGMLPAVAAAGAGTGSGAHTGTHSTDGAGHGTGGHRERTADEREAQSFRVLPGSLPAAVTLPWGTA